MVEKDAAGNYLVSSRHLRCIAYISGTTGDVLWRLGGKQSSFTDLSGGEAGLFVGQHDSHWHHEDDRTFITFFDNRADWHFELEHLSKGRQIELDLQAMTAKVDKTFVHPLNIFSFSQGSYQTLPNGNVLLGYGYSGAVTEFSPDGEVLCDAYIQPSSRFSSGDVQSYRNMKFNWTGNPLTKPAVALEQGILYVSWLGSTKVRSWALQHAHEVNGEYDATVYFDKTGFETLFPIDTDIVMRQFIRVAALDDRDEVIKTSAPLDLDIVGIKWAYVAEHHGIVSADMEVILGYAVGVLILVCIVSLFWTFRGRRQWAGFSDAHGMLLPTEQGLQHQVRRRLGQLRLPLPLPGFQQRHNRATISYHLLPTDRRSEDYSSR